MTKPDGMILCFFIMASLGVCATGSSTDRVFQVQSVMSDGADPVLILSSLDGESDLPQRKLKLIPGTRIVDLCAARVISPSGIRAGDIIFIKSSVAPSEILIITPGRSVHPTLAARQPDEARGINRLSRSIAEISTREDSSLEKIRSAFVFVLEYATGALFSAEQERRIQQGLSQEWWQRKTEAERNVFGRYPSLVALILQGNRGQLEDLHKTLSSAVSDWLRTAPAEDMVVKTIREQMAASERILQPGPPPLNEKTAMAYAELVAYASRSPHRPQTGENTALKQRIHAELIHAWQRLSEEERNQVCSAPGVWRVIRTIMVFGTPQQQETAAKMVENLKEADSSESGENSAERKSVKRRLASNMVRHNAMMAIRDQTFKTWLWSRRFH